MLKRIDSSQFTRRRWEAGSVHRIIGNNPCRTWYLTKPEVITQLQKYAVGWCQADDLIWKPKAGEIAIMCFMDGEHFWFHLRGVEARKIINPRRDTRYDYRRI